MVMTSGTKTGSQRNMKTMKMRRREMMKKRMKRNTRGDHLGDPMILLAVAADLMGRQGAHHMGYLTFLRAAADQTNLHLFLP